MNNFGHPNKQLFRRPVASGLFLKATGTRSFEPEVEFRVAIAKPVTVYPEIILISSFDFRGQNALMVLTRHA